MAPLKIAATDKTVEKILELLHQLFASKMKLEFVKKFNSFSEKISESCSTKKINPWSGYLIPRKIAQFMFP